MEYLYEQFLEYAHAVTKTILSKDMHWYMQNKQGITSHDFPMRRRKWNHKSPCPMGLCASFGGSKLATLWSKWWTLWSKITWKLMGLLLHISQMGRFRSLQAWGSISTIQAKVQGVLGLGGGEQRFQLDQGNSSSLWIIIITQWHKHYLCPTRLTKTSKKDMTNLVICAVQVWQYMSRCYK